MSKPTEGHVSFKGYKTFYKVFGIADSQKTPLLVLHGGPGSTHNYLLGLAALAEGGRQVIFYDQLGCGKSDIPKDDLLWNVRLFTDEIDAVRQELGLDAVHLLGHSWGGMLAIDYLLGRPKGVRSAILASTMVSLPLYQREVDKLKAALPLRVAMALEQHEAAGTTDSPEYKAAYSVYSKHHLFRGALYPEKYSSGSNDGDAVYNLMWGPSEAFVNGSLKDWDRIDRLPEITLPTLITSGQYDELTPWQAAITRNQMPNSRLNIITNGSHLAHIEQEEYYLQIVSEFLTDVES